MDFSTMYLWSFKPCWYIIVDNNEFNFKPSSVTCKTWWKGLIWKPCWYVLKFSLFSLLVCTKVHSKLKNMGKCEALNITNISGWKEELGGKCWIMVWKLYLNERKYYNEVTIPYSAWNEPLSTLINQQDPAMRAFKDYIAFIFHKFCYDENTCMFNIVHQPNWF